MSRGRGRRTRRTAPAVVAAALVLGVGSCTERPTTHHGPGTGHEVVTGPAGTLLPGHGEGSHDRLRQVPVRDEAPTVTLTVRPDAEDGWNVRLDVGRFRFTPDSVGGAAVLGTGHAHLLLDGRKIARVYGSRHHLSAERIPPGGGTLTARLVADDHTTWAVEGSPVQDSVRLPGASPAPTPEPGPRQTDQTDQTDGNGQSTQPTQSAQAVDITIVRGRISPTPGRIDVRKGRPLDLRVTSDTDDELHVHGVDRSAELKAGRTTTLRVVMDRAGLFEVETHRSGLVLAQLAVR
ncbi:cupredoxin domain-containing protein [Streptomyces tirandamycinicus]|uniref:hypothetical protein n=1 Tax=Streptomyces tirandamycinicus TaxID=2174846 RepID=UPI0022707186|nr:hypothetical protein [Streptomyces tirandamycinicus]MCY0980340.1 hypothetical protein [Streptomyces tirandamycinicus]